MNVELLPKKAVPMGDSARLALAGNAQGGFANIELREFLRILNRRKWLVFLVAAVTVLLAAIMLSQLTPNYTSSAAVMLDLRKTRVTNVTDVVSSLNVEPVAIFNEIEVIKSRALADRVVEKLALQNDPEFNGTVVKRGLMGTLLHYTGLEFVTQFVMTSLATRSPASGQVEIVDPEKRKRDTAAQRLLDGLAVTARGRSYVINISFVSPDPRKAAVIANTVANLYIVDQLESKFEATRRATDWLNDKLGDLRARVEASERAAADFRSRSGLTQNRQETVLSQQVGELNTQLSLARAQTAEKEARLRQVQDMVSKNAGTDSLAEVLASPLIQRLREQESELARRGAELGTRYGPNHPTMLKIKAEQQDLQRKIVEEARKIVQSLSNEVSVARTRQNVLQQQVSQLEKQSGTLGQASVQLAQLEREAESNRLLYQNFLNRFKETREQEDLQQADARIVSEAAVSQTPSYPRYGLVLMVALIAGSVLGFALAFAIERLDSGFRSLEQIESMFGFPTLGAIPLVVGWRRKLHDYLISKPLSAYAEALRSVYTAISLATVDSPAKVVAVTSSLPDEGKTTFTVSLARLLAGGAQNRRVVVVDLDLRRGAVAKMLPSKSSGSIEDYMLGKCQLDDIIWVDEKTGLHVVTSKKTTTNPIELLDSQSMREFIRELTQRFEVVILDTPPVMAVSDARIIAGFTDYVVFLVRWERTPRVIVAQALKLMTEATSRVGIALTQVNARRQAKYGYSDYGYYGKYRSYYRN